MKSASWAFPVVAAHAVGYRSPHATAGVPAASVPTVILHGAIAPSETRMVRVGEYLTGAVRYDAAGTRETTGSVFVEFETTGAFTVVLDEDAFADAGWMRISLSGEPFTFLSTSLRDGEARSFPRVNWVGDLTATGALLANVRTENPGIAAVDVIAWF